MSTESQTVCHDDIRRLLAHWSIDCGVRVNRRRSELGLDRKQLAQAAGTTQATIHRVETGKMHPRDHMKLAIAAALDVEVDELWPYPAVTRASSRSAISM